MLNSQKVKDSAMVAVTSFIVVGIGSWVVGAWDAVRDEPLLREKVKILQKEMNEQRDSINGLNTNVGALATKTGTRLPTQLKAVEHPFGGEIAVPVMKPSGKTIR